MNAKELAELLNNCQIGDESKEKEIILLAKENNLVIVFGASDDLMEFRGAIDDELGACGGSTVHLDGNGFVHLDGNGLIENKCDNENCPYYLTRIVNAKSTIKALWCATEECDWTYETSIPHETFDVMEDDRKYCRGIVFSMGDVT